MKDLRRNEELEEDIKKLKDEVKKIENEKEEYKKESEEIERKGRESLLEMREKLEQEKMCKILEIMRENKEESIKNKERQETMYR